MNGDTSRVDMGESLRLDLDLVFSLDLPTRITFGPGVRAGLADVVAALGRRAVLVAGASFAVNPAAAGLADLLADRGLLAGELTAGTGEPDVDSALALARQIEAAAGDVVVAVGGGSVLDLAKVAALLPDEAQLRSWLAGERVASRRGVPVVALPTTAGSGAEVSHGAILLDRCSGRKRGVRGSGVSAAVALVDPELTASADQRVTAVSGFDALAHAVETAASRAASDLVLRLSGTALPHLLAALPDALADGSDEWARTRASYAALLMGINLAASTTCLPHRLQYPVGARTGTPHAVGVAALLPAWLRQTREAAPESLGRLGVAAGLVAPGASLTEAADALVAAVEAHIDRTAMRFRLRDLGLAGDDLAGLVDAVEGSVANDPGPTSRADLLALYEASL